MAEHQHKTIEKAIYRTAIIELALASQTGLVIPEIASQLEVNPRTIRRALNDLVILGIDIEKKRSSYWVSYHLVDKKQGGMLRPVMAQAIAYQYHRA
jgi:predicted DNA-binding transcriptional regulator YafY